MGDCEEDGRLLLYYKQAEVASAEESKEDFEEESDEDNNSEDEETDSEKEEEHDADRERRGGGMNASAEVHFLRPSKQRPFVLRAGTAAHIMRSFVPTLISSGFTQSRASNPSYPQILVPLHQPSPHQQSSQSPHFSPILFP